MDTSFSPCNSVTHYNNQSSLRRPNNYNNENGGGMKKPSSTGKAVKLSTDRQSVAARERRHRISDRFKILQSLVPGGSKMDTVSMLEGAIHYVNLLKSQIWLHETMINFVAGDPDLHHYYNHNYNNYVSNNINNDNNILTGNNDYSSNYVYSQFLGDALVRDDQWLQVGDAGVAPPYTPPLQLEGEAPFQAEETMSCDDDEFMYYVSAASLGS